MVCRYKKKFLNAAMDGDFPTIVKCIDKGVDLDVHHETFGKSALAFALEFDHEKIALYLIDEGADIYSVANNKLALEFTAYNSQVFDKLIPEREGVSDEARIQTARLCVAISTGDHCRVEKVLKSTQFLNVPDMNNRTPIFYAILRNNPKILHRLIDAGADINAQDNMGDTPILFAMRWTCRGMRKDNMIRILVERGADLTIKNEFGETVIDASRPLMDNPYYSDEYKTKIKTFLQKGLTPKAIQKAKQKALRFKEKERIRE